MFLDLASPMESFMYEYGTPVIIIGIIAVIAAGVLITRAVIRKKRRDSDRL
ncbi:MAG: hypothetical protein J5824_07885 [Lachnospiraceae bacterium]|nr:hypothetical protein [Lachnospiraceae bacterium]